MGGLRIRIPLSRTGESAAYLPGVAILKRFWRGWAVSALFGQTTGREGFFLSLIVVAAVAWPILLIAIAAPKIAVQMIALVPLPDRVPSWTVRLGWIGLALLIPLGVGVAVSVKTPPAMRQGAPLLRVLRGFPITVGLAGAFAIIFVSVPIMRVAALVRRQKITDIPLIMSAFAYHEVAAKICEVLNRQGLSLQSAAPGWWVSAPMRLLAWLGGEALRSHVPKRFEHFVAHDLALSLYPTGLVLRGHPARLTWAHGLVAEAVVHTEGLQTTDPRAQALEQRLRPLWRSYDLDPARRARGADLARELDQITRELRILQVDWDDWQVLYRQILQLGRAAHGERQLLDAEPPPPAAQPHAREWEVRSRGRRRALLAGALRGGMGTLRVQFKESRGRAALP